MRNIGLVFENDWKWPFWIDCVPQSNNHYLTPTTAFTKWKSHQKEKYQEGLFFISTEKYRKKKICVNFTIRQWLAAKRCLANRAKAVKTRCAKTGLIDMLPIFQYRLIWQPINRPRTLCKEKEEESFRRIESKNFLLCCENWLLQQATLNFWNLWTEPHYLLLKTVWFNYFSEVVPLVSVFNAIQ